MLTTKNNPIQLSDHFTFKKLIRFTISPVLMMIFTSTYGVVDGFFVSNYAGSTAFSALNLSIPFIMLLASIGFMFGSGGVAYVSMTLGQGKSEKANKDFSMIVYTLAIVGFVFSALGFIFAPFVARLLGADSELLPYSVLYIRINMVGLVFFMLQNLFQSFLISAERPKYGIYFILAAGFTNMFLDYLLVGILNLGLAGAAWATITGQFVGGFIPVIYFLCPTTKKLHLGKPSFDFKVIARVCSNGVSEMVSSVAMSFVGILLNHQLISLFGNIGLSAYGVLMYVGFIVAAIFIGFSMGVSPIISFHYGAENHKELKNLLSKSLVLIFSTSIFLTICFELFTKPLAKLFVGYDEELLNLTLQAFRIYAFVFLFMGFNNFGSAFFTALNNGLISAFLSFFRVLILETTFIYLFPMIFGKSGIWWVSPGVDFCCIFVTIGLILAKKNKYGY